MYDLAEVRDATQAWWAGLARGFAKAGLDQIPAELTVPGDAIAHWRAPGLLFSQTCGLPYTQSLVDDVQLVATPCYAARGCDGPTYCSVLLTGAASSTREMADLRIAKVAVNSFGSQSGWVALCAALTDSDHQPAFSDILITGSHAASIEAVARGEAKLCAVDCVTFALLERHVPATVANVEIVHQSPEAPGLPYITGAATSGDDVERLRDGLRRALDAPDLTAARETLLIEDCKVLEDTAYDRIREMVRGPGVSRQYTSA